jgi:glycosyltransferase involved in cell wall biosynthesis
LHAWLKRIPIIQRLDGVYYPQSVAGPWYRWHNLPLKIGYRYFASQVIFQSEYSKQCATTFLGEMPAGPATIIYNGVDTDHFSPVGEAEKLRQNPEQQVFITWSRFRRADQINPLLEAVDRYRQRYSTNCRLVIAGDFSGAVRHLPEQLRQLPYVDYRGVVSNTDLPRLARGADVFLFAHQNPPCPNNVLEAMACGLPICGVADGAMPEITQPGINSELVAARGEGFFSPRSFSLDDFVTNLAHILEHRVSYSAASRQLALDRFNLPLMIERYESFILQ